MSQPAKILNNYTNNAKKTEQFHGIVFLSIIAISLLIYKFSKTVETFVNKKIKKINKKIKKQALAQALSKKNLDKNLYILSDVKKELKKTKDFNKFLISNKISNVIIVSDKESQKNINRSARNIKNVKIINDSGANVYDFMKFKNRILDEKN